MQPARVRVACVFLCASILLALGSSDATTNGSNEVQQGGTSMSASLLAVPAGASPVPLDMLLLASALEMLRCVRACMSLHMKLLDVCGNITVHVCTVSATLLQTAREQVL